MKWEECGPAVVGTNEHEGFGAILERAVMRGLNGSLSREWKSNGLLLSLKIPLARLAG
jgi:hypothetical protein